MNRTFDGGTPVLLCGVGPVPLGNPSRLYAPGLRIWGFAQGLLEAGERVDLLEVEFGKATEGGSARLLHLCLDSSGEITAEAEPLSPAPPATLVAEAMKRGDYKALVSSTDVMNRACAESCGTHPLWCDYFGHPMAERQSMACVYESDAGLAAQWDYLLPSLLRGDRFSGCSEPQRLALLGELGACGRMNRLTDGWPLAVSLPQIPVFTRFSPTRQVLHGIMVPDDAFVVLWTGGYNTWADVGTLARGLLDAMEQDHRIHFVSTGGAIAGHDEKTFGRFQDLVRESRHCERFHFAGWVETGDVPNYYLESSVGVNCDRMTLEGLLGTRNRIMDWVCAGLPVVTTDLCELTHWLAEQRLVDTFVPGDSSALAEHLVRMAGDEATARQRAEAARNRLLEIFRPKTAYAELIEWVRSPEHAPDLRFGLPGYRNLPYAIPDNSLAHRRADEWIAAESGERVGWGKRFLRLVRRRPH